MIQDVITRDFLFDPASFVIAVRGGIVTVSGELEGDDVGYSRRCGSIALSLSRTSSDTSGPTVLETTPR